MSNDEIYIQTLNELLSINKAALTGIKTNKLELEKLKYYLSILKTLSEFKYH